MRIATLNTWKNTPPYRRRLAAACAALEAARPDIVLLQEVFAGGEADTAAWLAAGLGLRLAAVPNRRKPRDHEGASVDSTNGLAVLSRHGVDETSLMALPPHPRDPERIAQLTRIGAVTVVNLHLTHIEDADEARAAQITAVLSAVPASGPVVIGGDFNATPDAPAIAAMAAAGYCDLAGDGPFPTCGGRRLDYLFARDLPLDGLSVTPVGDRPHDGVLASDHIGVLAALSDEA